MKHKIQYISYSKLIISQQSVLRLIFRKKEYYICSLPRTPYVVIYPVKLLNVFCIDTWSFFQVTHKSLTKVVKLRELKLSLNSNFDENITFLFDDVLHSVRGINLNHYQYLKPSFMSFSCPASVILTKPLLADLPPPP